MADASLKLSVDGASQFKKDIADITAQSKLLAAQTKAVTSGFSESTSKEEKYQKTTEALNKQIENQKKYMEALAKAIDASKTSTGEATSETTKLETQYAKAQTALNKMSAELNSAEKEFREEGNAAKESGEKTSSFKDSLRRVGELLAAKGIEKGLDALKNGLTGMANAAKAAAKAAAQTFTDSAQWADDLATLSIQTGISTEKLQEYQYMADLVDTDVNTITGAMAKLIKNMSSASTGTGAAADAFAKLGVSITDNNGQLRDNEEVFSDAITALGQMTNETERDALAMSIFGKSAQELNPLITAGGEQIAAFAQEAHNMGYVLDEEAIGALTESKDAMARLQNAGDALKRQFSAELAPTIADVGQSIADMFINNEELQGSIREIVAALGEIVQTILPQILPIIAELLPLVTDLAKDILPLIFDALDEILPPVIDLVKDLMPFLKEVLGIILPILTRLLTAIMPPILKIIRAILPVITSILKVLEPILNLVIDIIDPLLTIIADILSPLLDLLAPLLSLLGSVLAPILRELGPLIEVAFWPLKAVVIPLLNGVVDALKSVIGWIKDAVDWFGKLFGASNKASGVTGGSSRRSVESPVRSLNTAAAFNAVATDSPLASIGQPMLMRAPISPLAAISTMPERLSETVASGLGRVIRPTKDREVNNVTNYGGVTIEVHAAKGQDANEIANAVMRKMQSAVNRREAVFA